MLRTLLEAGFSHKNAAYAGFLMNDYVTTFVLEETRDASGEIASAPEDSLASVRNWIEGLPPNDYPSVVALADYLTESNADERFKFGIEILGKGLETRLPKPKA
jgi:hypothetical protein